MKYLKVKPYAPKATSTTTVGRVYNIILKETEAASYNVIEKNDVNERITIGHDTLTEYFRPLE